MPRGQGSAASTTGGTGSVHRQETMTPHAVQCDQEKRLVQNVNENVLYSKAAFGGRVDDQSKFYPNFEYKKNLVFNVKYKSYDGKP